MIDYSLRARLSPELWDEYVNITARTDFGQGTSADYRRRDELMAVAASAKPRRTSRPDDTMIPGTFRPPLRSYPGGPFTLKELVGGTAINQGGPFSPMKPTPGLMLTRDNYERMLEAGTLPDWFNESMIYEPGSRTGGANLPPPPGDKDPSIRGHYPDPSVPKQGQWYQGMNGRWYHPSIDSRGGADAPPPPGTPFFGSGPTRGAQLTDEQISYRNLMSQPQSEITPLPETGTTLSALTGDAPATELTSLWPTVPSPPPVTAPQPAQRPAWYSDRVAAQGDEGGDVDFSINPQSGTGGFDFGFGNEPKSGSPTDAMGAPGAWERSFIADAAPLGKDERRELATHATRGLNLKDVVTAPIETLMNLIPGLDVELTRRDITPTWKQIAGGHPAKTKGTTFDPVAATVGGLGYASGWPLESLYDFYSAAGGPDPRALFDDEPKPNVDMGPWAQEIPSWGAAAKGDSGPVVASPRWQPGLRFGGVDPAPSWGAFANAPPPAPAPGFRFGGVDPATSWGAAANVPPGGALSELTRGVVPSGLGPPPQDWAENVWTPESGTFKGSDVGVRQLSPDRPGDWAPPLASQQPAWADPGYFSPPPAPAPPPAMPAVLPATFEQAWEEAGEEEDDGHFGDTGTGGMSGSAGGGGFSDWGGQDEYGGMSGGGGW